MELFTDYRRCYKMYPAAPPLSLRAVYCVLLEADWLLLLRRVVLANRPVFAKRLLRGLQQNNINVSIPILLWLCFRMERRLTKS